MSDLYIKPAKAFNKLKQAYQRTRPVYIFGVSGFGKTSLVRNFLRNKKYFYISCKNEEWDTSFLLSEDLGNRLVTVVIDDLQNLNNPQCQNEVISLFDNDNIWPVLICRSKLPSWLMESYFEHSLNIIDENDLTFDTKEVKALFEETGISLSESKWDELRIYTQGNPFVLRCIKDNIIGTDVDNIIEKADSVFSKHIIENVFPYYDTEVLDFLVKVSIVDVFNVPMANMITGRSDCERLINKCKETGNFIITENNSYRIRPDFFSILNEYKIIEYDPKILTDCYYNAGIYYSITDHDEKEFRCLI